MYPNLEAEIERKGFKRKAISGKLELSYRAFYDKMNGTTSFTLEEALTIWREFFPESDLEWLFQKSE